MGSGELRSPFEGCPKMAGHGRWGCLGGGRAFGGQRLEPRTQAHPLLSTESRFPAWGAFGGRERWVLGETQPSGEQPSSKPAFPEWGPHRRLLAAWRGHLQGREELFAGRMVQTWGLLPQRDQAGEPRLEEGLCPSDPGPRVCDLLTRRPGLGTERLHGWWQQDPQDMAMSPTVHPVAI